MSRICVTTHYDSGFAELGDLCLASLRSYAERHGYALRTFPAFADERPIPWHKIHVIRRLFAEGFEHVLWVDADAVVTDPRRGIHEEIADGKDLGLVLHEYDGLRVPNAGVLLLRNSAWTHDLLDRIWAQEQYVDHPWWENAALIDLLGYHAAFGDGRPDRPSPELLPRVTWLPLRWNSLPELAEAKDAVIRHYAGKPPAYRVFHMRHDLREAACVDGACRRSGSARRGPALRDAALYDPAPPEAGRFLADGDWGAPGSPRWSRGAEARLDVAIVPGETHLVIEAASRFAGPCPVDVLVDGRSVGRLPFRGPSDRRFVLRLPAGEPGRRRLAFRVPAHATPVGSAPGEPALPGFGLISLELVPRARVSGIRLRTLADRVVARARRFAVERLSR